MGLKKERSRRFRCGAVLGLELLNCAGFAESLSRNLAKFSGRYLDKMDDTWTETRLSKRPEGVFVEEEGR